MASARAWAVRTAGMGRRWAASPLSLRATALVVVAALCAGWFGWSWAGAAHDDELTRARLRDTVLRAGESAIRELSTVDYRDAQDGLDRWERSTTGALHDQLAAGEADFLAKVGQSGVVTVAHVVEGAITELDDRTGHATVIVAVDVSVSPVGQPASTKRQALRGQLVRTTEGWKLSQVDDVPVTPVGP